MCTSRKIALQRVATEPLYYSSNRHKKERLLTNDTDYASTMAYSDDDEKLLYRRWEVARGI